MVYLSVHVFIFYNPEENLISHSVNIVFSNCPSIKLTSIKQIKVKKGCSMAIRFAHLFAHFK